MKAALCLIALVCAGCTYEQWDPMEEQPKPLPYQPSQLFPDQRAMRPVPAGTVAREAPRGELVHLQDRPDGGLVVIPPEPPLSAELLTRGEEQFEITCAACHGVRGDGVSVVATKMSLRAPPSLLVPPASALDDRQLYMVITDGYGMMPPLRAWFTPQDRWALVHYLRALRLASNVPASALDAADLAQLERDGGGP